MNPARSRHSKIVREHLAITPFAQGGREVMARTLRELAFTKQDLRDLINGAIETLVKERFELPSFGVLEEAAERVRGETHRALFELVFAALSEKDRGTLGQLFVQPGRDSGTTLWNDLKREPGRPTLTKLKEWLVHQQWLAGLQVGANVAALLSEAKVLHFAEETKSLNASRMQEVEPRKRFTLAACFLHVRHAAALDGLAELFVRRMGNISRDAQLAFEADREGAQQRVNDLVLKLKEVAVAYQREGSEKERLGVVGQALGEPGAVIEACEAHEALVQNSSAPFVWRCYASSRSMVHALFRTLTVKTTSYRTPGWKERCSSCWKQRIFGRSRWSWSDRTRCLAPNNSISPGFPRDGGDW